MKFTAAIHPQEPTYWTVVGADGLPYSFWETKGQAAKAARMMTAGKRPSYKLPGAQGESEIMETWVEEQGA
jgi:hypothetical protein